MKNIFFKLLVIVYVFFLLPGNGFSQGINIGIKAGVSSSNFITDLRSSGRFGVQGGVFFAKKFSKVGLKTEIIYSQQGSIGNAEFKRAVIGNSQIINKSTIKLNYINFPILATWHLNPSFYLQGGPQFGLLLTAEEEITTQRYNAVLGNEIDKRSEDIKDQIDNSDIGIVLGFGFNLPAGFGLGLRYNLGFSNINVTDTESIKNQVVTFDVSYLLVK